jgi:CheY-like chemotaxis protein
LLFNFNATMGKLIFFVDDDKMILNLLFYTFSGLDEYHVETFLKGEDCIAQLPNNPDLIVLDHSFLNENSLYQKGLEILKEIRKVNLTVPVIVLSGEQDEAVIEEYVRSGVTKFISKDSFFIDSLIETISETII